MEQKFKRGNVVKLYGRDELHIILGSYVDMFGGTISIDKGNESYWTYEKYIELVEEGSEQLIIDAKKKEAEIEARNKDLLWILTNWKDIRMFPPTATILYLFERIGAKSQFLVNGEYFTLTCEWQASMSLFDYIVNSPTEKQFMEVLHKDLSSEKLEKIFELFREVKQIQGSISQN